jgi:hypothetical protein
MSRIPKASSDRGAIPFTLTLPVGAMMVELRQGILDLEIHFSTGHVLHVIPNSSGYEAWNLCSGSRQYIAVGGGELINFGAQPNSH